MSLLIIQFLLFNIQPLIRVTKAYFRTRCEDQILLYKLKNQYIINEKRNLESKLKAPLQLAPSASLRAALVPYLQS